MAWDRVAVRGHEEMRRHHHRHAGLDRSLERTKLPQGELVHREGEPRQRHVGIERRIAMAGKVLRHGDHPRRQKPLDGGAAARVHL
jgi:hypothetical protein